MAPNSSQLDCAQRLPASKLYSAKPASLNFLDSPGAQRLPASKLYSENRCCEMRIVVQVLNAYRHQSYIQGRFKSSKDNVRSCSTPTGIKVIFRVICWSFIPGWSVCSTPIGIKVIFSFISNIKSSSISQCSTPNGIPIFVSLT